MKFKFALRHVVLLLSCLFLFWTLASHANANHSSGLHLQLPNKVVDIKSSDIDEVNVFQTGAQVASVMLSLKPASAARLTKLTENLIGQPVTWIWNGRVLYMQTLQTPINKDLTIYNFTAFEADEFKRKNVTSAANS